MKAELKKAIENIRKQHGTEVIMELGGSTKLQIDVIPTGSLAVDNILGVGGIPRGRVTEIFGGESSGKTTLCLHVIAMAQKAGGVGAFIDAEHALDPEYARHLGVDTEHLLISQPDCGEQALEVAEALIKSGAVDIVVIDSVAALVPRSELDCEMGQSQMGVMGRMMSQALRKLVAVTSKSNTVLIFTNQLREKIGVMFGCFHYTTRVVLADGSTRKIGTIVNQKLPLSVLSFNNSTGAIEPKKIIGWHNNGRAEDFWQFVVNSSAGSGTRKFSCTANHMLVAPDGLVSANDISVGNFLLNVVNGFELSFDQETVAIGSALGDGSLRKTALRLGHGIEQKDYLLWKRDVFKSVANSLLVTDKKTSFDTVPLRVAWFQDAPFGKKKGNRNLSASFLSKLSIQAVAIWYQDDGTFSGSYEKWGRGKSEICCKSFSTDQRATLRDALVRIGFPAATVTKRGLLFSGENNFQFQEKISPYIHPSMNYKLHPKLRGAWAWELKGDAKPIWIVESQKVLKKYLKPKNRSTSRFDLTIEGNHTYLADHIVVHNSPETQPGGRALKFFASVRLDVRRVKTNSEDEVKVSNTVKIKAIKNKVASPYKECEIELVFGEGVCREKDLITFGVEKGLISKAGAWYTLSEQRFQGEDALKAYLKSNPDIADKLETSLRVILFPKEG